MGNKKPKFKIGERVRVKNLAEAKETSCAVEINKPLKKYLGKNFVVTGFREVGGMFYYFLKERSSVCVHECLLDYPYGDFSHPQNPKYSVGDNVVIKEEKDLRETFSREQWWLKDLLPISLRVLQIYSSYWFCNQNVYEAEVEPGVYVKIPEKAILQETDCDPYQALDPYNVRVAFRKEGPEKSESSNNGMVKWKTMYKDMVEFISTSSPQTRSFIAGQLYGLTERLMNETLKEK
mgnify:CR=1 FL=1|jgi:hypothetical protein|uniref:Nitrile hydratase beta subunit n=1 Tax=Siphoviridae sp. ctHOG1 TaxID=2827829 RepID=A0A8S5SVF9_9CAUD|nr:MAG TPA: Nitrile hydratase beta subunit [Siphoviridae sp. ctHOG1]